MTPLTNELPRRTAFVTGATGFVGSFLVDRLLREGGHVVALARGRDARGRVCTALRNVRGEPAAAEVLEPGLRVVPGDVRDPLFGLSETDAGLLSASVDEVWHCAANFGSGASGETPLTVNVGGTCNALGFAGLCNRTRPVPFYYVSTAYAGDSRDGLTREEAPAGDGAERNEYESSKREAERQVLAWQREHGFPVAIFRPSIILGHSRTGRASGFAAYYDFLRSLCVLARHQRVHPATGGDTGTTIRVRTRSDLLVNLVTIDFVIDAMCALARMPRGADGVFNVVNDTSVTVGEIIAGMCRSIGLPGVSLCPEEEFAARPMTRTERMFHSMIGFERPYLEQEVRFDNRRLRHFLPSSVLPAPRVDPAMLQRINRGYLDFCARQAGESRGSRTSALGDLMAPAPAGR